jgi:hypothetical protein
MQLKLDRRFQKQIRGRFGKYEFEVGVLEDGLHKLPAKKVEGVAPLATYAGGPVRRKSSRTDGTTIADVSAANRERLGFNYLAAPFKKKSTDIVRFTKSFFRLAFGASERKRCENLLQAIVRNPILRGEYGPNSPKAQKAKGFDRAMIDTGQLFKAIKAICRVKRV